MSGLTNRQLEKLARKCLGYKFIGVYPADAEPKISNKKTNISIIFNLSNHDEPGSHYIAIHIKPKEIIYFDSYGKKLTNKYIKKYLKHFKKPILYHTKKIQHKESIFCGLFSLAYLHAVQNLKLPISTFYNFFQYPATMLNDTIVTCFLTRK
jgi:hypothetical protein